MSKFSFTNRLKSFKFAFTGIKLLFKNEHNAWIHLAFTALTIGGGLYFKISNMEWIAVILAIGIVLAAETFNTAIEQLANFIQPDQDQRIAAGGVLITAISAFFVGLIIFLPKFINLFNS